ncbi:hypothetical protein LCGC14_2735530 [marine sediment metagenome]|uniref:Uncharacterized protein n=1 Tax=marine sediment metagenome TaxID=412755 RepID=A0A0F9BXM2_9ZZZZ
MILLRLAALVLLSPIYLVGLIILSVIYTCYFLTELATKGEFLSPKRWWRR